MSSERELERSVEQFVREVASANRDIVALTTTIREIERFARTINTADIRRSFSIKSDLRRLQDEVRELEQNLRTLDRELTDTESNMRRALF